MSLRIVCLCQVYNEVEKGNLERFFEHAKPVFDDIVIYDDGSTDGSFEYALGQTPHLVRGALNDFAAEIQHKKLLLDAALTLEPDFVFLLDADEVLTIGAREALEEAAQRCIDEGLDALSFKQINLWRSASWERTDSSFGDGWFTRLLRVTPELRYEDAERGLHQQQFPKCVQKVERDTGLSVIHYGFADKRNLAFKYITYRSHGQRGYRMLDRIINEEQLALAPVRQDLFPESLKVPDEPEPKPIPFSLARAYVERFRPLVERPKTSVICLIYKSVNWLEFVYEQYLKYTHRDDVEFFFVANDASDEVKRRLENSYIPHVLHENTPEQRQEWYINNVYRAYNAGAHAARGDFLIFVNSDMAFSPGWLEALLGAYDGSCVVASRLIESGKLATGPHGIEKDFGRNLTSYDEAGFQRFAEMVREERVDDGGLFMPLLVRKKDFERVGGYPEGNAVEGSDPTAPTIAKPDDPQVSGDRIFIRKLADAGVCHRTAYDSVVYHFQCGERDDETGAVAGAPNSEIEVAIANDIVGGTMGEHTFWDSLRDSLPNAYPVDFSVVGKKSFERMARSYIEEQHPKTAVVIQNATFIRFIGGAPDTICMMVDSLRAMGRDASTQEATMKAASINVTNSPEGCIDYDEFDCRLVSIGVDEKLFAPSDRQKMRAKHSLPADMKIGMFVGSFSEVKGWSRIKACVESRPDIFWILVTKYQEDFEAPNARTFKQIGQQLLAELHSASDFFIIGSPVETQCLAAIEANFCDRPVLMHHVGTYAGMEDEDLARLGVFTDDLASGIDQVLEGQFTPRETILTMQLDRGSMLETWRNMIAELVLKQRHARISGTETEVQSALEWRLSQLEFALRRNVYRPVFGSRYPDFRRILSGKGVEVYFREVIRGSRADRFWREKVRGKPPKPGRRYPR